MPWNTWSPQPNKNQPIQNWQGYAHGNQTYQQAYPQPYQQSFAYQQYQHSQPSFNSQPNPSPQLTQPQQFHLPSNQPPPRPTQLPAQPVPNPNNRVEKLMYNINAGTTVSYSILLVQNIHLRSGKFLEKASLIIIKEQTEKEKIPKKN